MFDGILISVYLFRKLTDNYTKYWKSFKLALSLSRYIKDFLYIYRYLYKCFGFDNEYYKRVAKILAVYTDLELFCSMRGHESDADTANRIQLMYHTYMEVKQVRIGRAIINFASLTLQFNRKAKLNPLDWFLRKAARTTIATL